MPINQCLDFMVKLYIVLLERKTFSLLSHLISFQELDRLQNLFFTVNLDKAGPFPPLTK